MGGQKVIQARASYRHARQLAEEASARWGPEVAGQLVQTHMLRLDDPQNEGLLALRGGEPVGYASVLSVGELGRIEDVYVAEGYRRQGIGRTVMSRAIELCLRSLFKHVFLTVLPDNEAAVRLYAHLGFVAVGEYVSYRRRG